MQMIMEYSELDPLPGDLDFQFQRTLLENIANAVQSLIARSYLCDPGWLCDPGLNFLFFFLSLFVYFIYLESTQVSTQACERGRGTQTPKPAPHCQHRVWTHEPKIMTWSEIKNQILNLQNHPGAPDLSFWSLIPELISLSQHLSYLPLSEVLICYIA